MVGGPRVAGAALTFLAQVLLARWMGADQLGIYVLAFALCTVAALACGLGLPSAAPRFIAEALARNEPRLFSGFVIRSRQITAAAACALSLLLVAVALFTPGPPLHHGLEIIAAVMLPLMALARLQLMIELSLSRTPQAFLPEFVLRPALFLALLAGLWWLIPTLSALTALWAQGVAVVAVVLVQLWLFRSVPEPRPLRRGAVYRTRLWLATAMPLLTVDLFTSYFAEINVLAFGIFASPDEVAVLHVAFRIAMLIGLGVHAIESAILPETARHHATGNTPALRRSIGEANTVRLLGGLVAVAAVIAAGSQLLGLFGDQFRTGYCALVLLLLAQLTGVLAGPTAQLLSVSGGERDCARAVAVSLTSTLLLQALLVPTFHLNGAAAAVLAGTIIWHGTLLWLAHRRLGFLPIQLLWPSTR